jgi:hypothetical protein
MIRLLRLNKLFSLSSRSRPSGTPDPYRGLSKGKSGQSGSPRIKNNSFFGTHGTKFGEEDEFEMIGKQGGKGATWTGQVSRGSNESDSASHESTLSRPTKQAGIGQGIVVQREWDVSHVA